MGDEKIEMITCWMILEGFGKIYRVHHVELEHTEIKKGARIDVQNVNQEHMQIRRDLLNVYHVKKVLMKHNKG